MTRGRSVGAVVDVRETEAAAITAPGTVGTTGSANPDSELRLRVIARH